MNSDASGPTGRATAVGSILALLAAVMGCATATKDPTVPVREAYRMEAAHVAAEVASSRGPPRHDLLAKAQPPWFEANRVKIFSARLRTLWDAEDRLSAETGEIGAIDADPFLDAQDFDDDVLHDLAIELVQRTGDRAEVRAHFTNFGEQREIRFDVVFEAGRWVIDDIRANGRSVAKALAYPL